MSIEKEYDASVIRIRERSDAHRRTEITKKNERIDIVEKDFHENFTVKPKDDELVIGYEDPRAIPYINDIRQINVMMTNACNLNCTYCYQQHRKDYGKWNVDSLHSVFKFLMRHSRNQQLKSMQFFGGEPLIHKKLILQYLDTYQDVLNNAPDHFMISMVTNGLLLDENFIKEYFSYKFTSLTISLDTFDVNKDHRELSQKQMDKIRENLSIVKKYIPDGDRHTYLTARITLSPETYEGLFHFAEELKSYGVQELIVHPLTMSNYKGYIEWSDEQWDVLLEQLIAIVLGLDMEVNFSEGVAERGATSNCLVGNRMIAIDATGDYSGCYFFTNLKNAAQPFILGNIFDNRFYLDRYKHYQKLYEDYPKQYPKCQKCDINNFCYQCPAGHADLGRETLFTPDSMCQKIVRMHLKLCEVNNVRERLKYSSIDKERDDGNIR